MTSRPLSQFNRRRETSTSQSEAEALSATLPQLLIEAERVANTVEQGLHGRKRTGPGESFWQYRRYTTGDMASAVDWRQSAKSQHLYVRENEWDAAQSAWLWCDRTPSMAYRSAFAPTTKQDRGLLLGLALGGLLTRGGERVASLDANDIPLSGKAGLTRLAENWLTKTDKTQATGLPPLRELPRYGSLILIGDFLDPEKPLIERLRQLAASGVKGHLIQILDPAETDLPFEGRTEFEGVEDLTRLLVQRAEDLQDAYRKRLTQLQATLADTTRTLGWSFTKHQTDHSPTSALLSLYGHIAGHPDQQFEKWEANR
ncbi:MAG: DUF58 domain-containing protein [Parvibaculum sp.]